MGTGTSIDAGRALRIVRYLIVGTLAAVAGVLLLSLDAAAAEATPGAGPLTEAVTPVVPAPVVEIAEPVVEVADPVLEVIQPIVEPPDIDLTPPPLDEVDDIVEPAIEGVENLVTPPRDDVVDPVVNDVVAPVLGGRDGSGLGRVAPIVEPVTRSVAEAIDQTAASLPIVTPLLETSLDSLSTLPLIAGTDDPAPPGPVGDRPPAGSGLTRSPMLGPPPPSDRLGSAVASATTAPARPVTGDERSGDGGNLVSSLLPVSLPPSGSLTSPFSSSAPTGFGVALAVLIAAAFFAFRGGWLLADEARALRSRVELIFLVPG